MIRLLPAVCRDCGLSADKAPLSPYLDFQLCNACLSKREKKFREAGESRSRGSPLPAGAQGKKTTRANRKPRKVSPKNKNSRSTPPTKD